MNPPPVGYTQAFVEMVHRALARTRPTKELWWEQRELLHGHDGWKSDTIHRFITPTVLYDNSDATRFILEFATNLLSEARNAVRGHPPRGNPDGLRDDAGPDSGSDASV